MESQFFKKFYKNLNNLKEKTQDQNSRFRQIQKTRIAENASKKSLL